MTSRLKKSIFLISSALILVPIFLLVLEWALFSLPQEINLYEAQKIVDQIEAYEQTRWARGEIFSPMDENPDDHICETCFDKVIPNGISDPRWKKWDKRTYEFDPRGTWQKWRAEHRGVESGPTWILQISLNGEEVLFGPP